MHRRRTDRHHDEPRHRLDTDDATVTVASDGGVEGETDVPEAPQTDAINSSGDAGNTLPILLAVLGIIGLAAVVLTPARARRR